MINETISKLIKAINKFDINVVFVDAVDQLPQIIRRYSDHVNLSMAIYDNNTIYINKNNLNKTNSIDKIILEGYVRFMPIESLAGPSWSKIVNHVQTLKHKGNKEVVTFSGIVKKRWGVMSDIYGPESEVKEIMLLAYREGNQLDKDSTIKRLLILLCKELSTHFQSLGFEKKISNDALMSLFEHSEQLLRYDFQYTSNGCEQSSPLYYIHQNEQINFLAISQVIEQAPFKKGSVINWYDAFNNAGISLSMDIFKDVRGAELTKQAAAKVVFKYFIVRSFIEGKANNKNEDKELYLFPEINSVRFRMQSLALRILDENIRGTAIQNATGKKQSTIQSSLVKERRELYESMSNDAQYKNIYNGGDDLQYLTPKVFIAYETEKTELDKIYTITNIEFKQSSSENIPVLVEKDLSIERESSGLYYYYNNSKRICDAGFATRELGIEQQYRFINEFNNILKDSLSHKEQLEIWLEKLVDRLLEGGYTKLRYPADISNLYNNRQIKRISIKQQNENYYDVTFHHKNGELSQFHELKYSQFKDMAGKAACSIFDMLQEDEFDSEIKTASIEMGVPFILWESKYIQILYKLIPGFLESYLDYGFIQNQNFDGLSGKNKYMEFNISKEACSEFICEQSTRT